jgi:hypothetical protein
MLMVSTGTFSHSGEAGSSKALESRATFLACMSVTLSTNRLPQAILATST